MLRRLFGGATPKKKEKDHGGVSSSVRDTHCLSGLSCTTPAVSPRTTMAKVRCDPVPAALKKRPVSVNLESSTLQLSTSQPYLGTATTTESGSPLVTPIASVAIPIASHGNRHARPHRAASLQRSGTLEPHRQTAAHVFVGAKSCTFSSAAVAVTAADLSDADPARCASAPHFSPPKRSQSTPHQSSVTNYWRLPWSQKKVAMCPNCNRPLRPNAARGAKAGQDALYSVGDGRSDSLHSHPSDAASESRETNRDACGTVIEVCCHCGMSVEVPPSAEVSPTTSSPVYVVQPVSAEQALSGTIAVESDSDSDAELGTGLVSTGARVRLSLVTPLRQNGLLETSSVEAH